MARPLLRFSHVTVAAVALLSMSCATVPPPSGLVWGYVAEFGATANLRGVVYTLDRPVCEVTRANAMKTELAWGELKIPAECRRLVAGHGTDYWVYTTRNTVGDSVAVGFNERDWCVRAQQAGQQTSRRGMVSLSDCQPVALNFQP